MNQALKLGRVTSQSSTIFSSSSSPLASTRSSKGLDRVRFMQVASGKDPKHSNRSANMDANKNDDQKDMNLNAMEESFGAGYATRSDEEGFGGVYGGNKEDNAEMKIDQDPAHHERSQGSEVKEKERARNQTKAK